MSGCVEHSSATSIVLALSASAIGVLHAARSVAPAIVSGVMPYCSSAPPGAPHSGLVGQSVARPHLSWVWTAAVSLILVRLNCVAVSGRTTNAFVSTAGV